jgi:hypothetical protein
MRALSALVLAVVLAGLAAGTASAKLTPAEQKWVTPLLRVWEKQNAGLNLVLKAATVNNSAGMVPGTTENRNLVTILAALIDCKEPTDRIKKAGTPASPRLTPFRDALNSACIHDANGAHDFAKAIAAFGKKQNKLGGTLLVTGVAEFKKGTAQISKAYKALTAIGGKNLFSS